MEAPEFHQFVIEGDQTVGVFRRNRLLLHGRMIQQFDQFVH
jgi:hypothetical protein